MSRIYLSPPDMNGLDREYLLDAFDSNWIAPQGPHVESFERELADVVGVRHAVALSSGTAGLHLALHGVGVKSGDDVITSSMTFAATANAITYLGAKPVFLDVLPSTWTMDPEALADELASRAKSNRLPAAVVTVDLYGQCCDYAPILRICDEYGVPVVEDAAEALGASYGHRAAGQFGRCAVFSFNGNKIITTSGGGMLVSDDADIVTAARHLATQARDPAPHYEHSKIGFNYRLSNLVAALGRSQLISLPGKLLQRRRINERYRHMLRDVAGITFLLEADYGRSNCWLTCIQIDPKAFHATREDLRLALEAEDIESRPVWKPMHLQPVFAGCHRRGGAVSERIFRDGLCLPSGSNLRDEDQDRIVGIIRAVHERAQDKRATITAC